MSVRRALARLQPVLVLAALFFIGVLLARQWHALAGRAWRLRPAWLLLSAPLIVGSWFVEVRLWQRALDALGGRLAFRPAVSVWFSSAIVRYLPGNIWQPLSMTVQCQEYGIRPEVTIAGMLLFYLLLFSGVGVMAAATLALGGGAGLGGLSRWWALAAVAPVAGLIAWPGAIRAVVNAALRWLGREPFPFRLSPVALSRTVVLPIVSWTLMCAGFATLVAAVASPARAGLGSALGSVAFAYPVAYAIGFASFLTPSGLGVREGVLYALLTPTLGGAAALVVTLAMRLWEVGLELAVCGAVVGLPRMRRARPV